MLGRNLEFPQQKVGASIKNKPEWYANCIDFVIDSGVSMNDRSDAETKLAILRGDIPNSFYKKVLNPYNSANERYTRFPATMRNFDIMQDIIRRYISEYAKGIHEFVVGANNPEVVLKKDAKLREKLGILASLEFQQEFERRMQELQQQTQQSGQQEAIDPQQAMPDPEEFIKNFNEKYIDDESKQGQDMLDFIRSITDDNVLYLSAFFNYCAVGECYTYSDIRGESIYKEHVPILEAYPIPNDKFFVEDHDMFARKMSLSYPQILDMFDDVLTKKDKEYLDKYYKYYDHGGVSHNTLLYNQYFEYYPDNCEKFTKEEREFFRANPVRVCDVNNQLFEVWHVVWRGQARRGILTRVNQIGFQEEVVVDEDYEFSQENGDIDIRWVFEEQIYEGYRIGGRYSAIYPIKARPIAYQRNGKLPYNGIMEILPLMGKFSIIQLITPYQIMRNIIIYHREMVIAKNKMLILLLPESLIADETEDKIYKMAADGVLIVDDSEDANSQKMANIRMLNASLGDYITQLTNLIEAIKLNAREMVDMNAQRYGEIAQSAGAATTQEAVARSSMGSVIITLMFDELRKRDYQRDLDYAKLAYVEGLQTTFYDDTHQMRYLSLDVNSFINSSLSVLVKNDQKELDKIQQLRQWAFSAAQNGDLDMAIAAITGNNVTQIKDTVNKFMKIKRQHEQEMQQAEQMLKQEELQARIAEIQAKGEEDRKTEMLKYQYELQLKYIDVDMSMLGDNSTDNDAAANQRLNELAEANKTSIARQKLTLEQQKLQADLYNKAADRQIAREKMQNDLRIAKTNKNKYDK